MYELRSACKQRGLAVAARLKRSDLVDSLLRGGAVRREEGRKELGRAVCLHAGMWILSFQGLQAC